MFRKFIYLLALVFLLALSSCGRANTDENLTEEYNYSEVPNEASDEVPDDPPPFIQVANVFDFSSDAILLVETVEISHPIFIMDGFLPDNYAYERDAFLELTESILLTVTEFVWAIRRYVTLLRDFHMVRLPQGGNYVNFECIYRDGRFYLLDEYGATIEIVAIGGVSVTELIHHINIYFYFENDAARQLYYPQLIRYTGLLRRIGALEPGNSRVAVTMLYDGDKRDEYYNLAPISQTGGQTSPRYYVSHTMIDDIFIADVRAFGCRSGMNFSIVEGDYGSELFIDLCRIHEEFYYAIETAVENGVRKFIVDVRDNPGGNSHLAHLILYHMGMTRPEIGAITRLTGNEILRGFFGGSDADDLDYVTIDRNTEIAKNPNNIDLVVLTNNITASSSTFLAMWVQDGNLGHIIGEPSTNAPSSFGNVFPLRLPTLNRDISISHSKWLRPDATADQTTVWPDIIVPSDEALDAAIEFLRNRSLE